MATPPIFNIDALRQNEHSRTTVVLPIGTTKLGIRGTSVSKGNLVRESRNNTAVTGFVTEGFALTGGSDWNSPFESSAIKSLNEKINMAAVGGKQLGGLIPGLDKVLGSVGHISLQEQGMTTLMWLGPQRPSFTLAMTFIAIRPEDDVRNPVRVLMRTVFPSIKRRTAEEDPRLKRFAPPLGYTINSNGVARGTVTLAIGTWLRITHLVVRDVNAVFSKETVKINDTTSAPLYANVTIQFAPYKQPTDRDIDKYLRLG